MTGCCLRVPARDAQLILGHSRLAVTLEIYTHEDRQAQHEALGKVSAALGHDEHHKDDQKRSELVSIRGVNRQSMISTDYVVPGGAKGTRTPDPLLANLRIDLRSGH